ncbi:MAG TPA: DJ-1/PfpI family protein [Streptosporangiaceae bacterium]|nr:DJ-1/PfpI family protein [Streptosporangiaceae bacterium]
MADQPLRGPKIAILLALAGTEQAEFAEPRKGVIDAGADVEVISAQTGPVRTVNHDLDPGETFTVDKAFDQVSADDYDAVIVPGGTVGADKLRGDPAAVRFVRSFFETGSPPGRSAMAHGSWSRRTWYEAVRSPAR